ncbi:hypothetical protein ACQRBF_05880 [Peptoniphilaceae bacterium SGI.131]
MNEFKVDKNIIVMSSEPYLDVTLEMVETAAKECETELELATLFAIVENKAWWIEDEEYDFAEGTEEHRQAVEKTELWFALADKLRKRIFCILQSEGVEIPSTGQITVLEPFMKRNGYKNGQGWWVKK